MSGNPEPFLPGGAVWVAPLDTGPPPAPSRWRRLWWLARYRTAHPTWEQFGWREVGHLTPHVQFTEGDLITGLDPDGAVSTHRVARLEKDRDDPWRFTLHLDRPDVDGPP